MKKRENLDKDFFNNKIKSQYINYMIFTIIFYTIIMLIGGTLFLYVALFYDKVEPENCRWIVFIISILCYSIGIISPILSTYLIRIFPKHKKITYFFIKKFVFVDIEDERDK